MKTVSKLLILSTLMLSITTPVLAQNPQDGDYYTPGPTVPQQGSPAQQRRIEQGDYYAPTRTSPQQLSPGQERKIQQGDYYSPEPGR